MHRFVPRLVVAGAALSGLLLATQVPASAAPTRVPAAVVVPPGTAGSGTTTPDSIPPVVSSGYASGPAGAKSFHVRGQSNFSTSCPILSLKCTASFSKNSSTTKWNGTKPAKANRIDATMKWWLNGLDVSVSLPPGASFSAINDGVLYDPGTVNNVKSVQLHYQAAVKLAAVVISGENFTAQGDILIGSKWYHVQGN